MHMWPFKKRSTVVEHVTNVDVMKRLIAVEETLAEYMAKHKSLQGRVYAIWGKEPKETAATPSDLNDPRLTKAQVRAALIAQGKLVARSSSSN